MHNQEKPKKSCSCPENICLCEDGEQFLSTSEVLDGSVVEKNQAKRENSTSSNSQIIQKNLQYSAKNYFESPRYAIEGIKLIIINERNFRIQLSVALVTIFAGLLLGISHQDWVALFVVIAIVLVAEAFNSVVEAICDTISKDFRINVKYAKDVSAGAVLVSALVSLLAGVIIFYPYIWSLVKAAIKQ